MVWSWVHNFPSSVDVFTKPIDYPDVGYDTIIANWLQDIFDGVKAIQEALGYDIRDGFADLATRLSGRIYHTRIVGETADFDEGDFTCDGDAHFLDLSAIIPVGTKAVTIDAVLWIGVAQEDVMYFTLADGGKNVVEFVFSAWGQSVSSFVMAVDENRRIQYVFSHVLIATSEVSITGWFK